MFAISETCNIKEHIVRDSTEYVSIPGDPQYLTVEEARAIEDLDQD
jgi:hypothetical protein